MFRICVLALILTGLIYSVAPSMAQDTSAPTQEATPAGGPPEHGHGFDPARRADMLAKHLQLSSDQQAKVLDILKSAQSQMESLRSDTSTPPQERRSKMMEIRKTSDGQIREVLSSDQQKKWDEMQSKHQQGPGRHGNGEPPSSTDSSEQK